MAGHTTHQQNSKMARTRTRQGDESVHVNDQTLKVCVYVLCILDCSVATATTYNTQVCITMNFTLSLYN